MPLRGKEAISIFILGIKGGVWLGVFKNQVLPYKNNNYDAYHIHSPLYISKF